MKKLILLFLIINSLCLFSQTETDSLLKIVNNDMVADTILHEAYEKLLSKLKEGGLIKFLEVAEKGLDQAKARKYTKLELVIMNKIGEAYYVRDKYVETHYYWIESLRIAEQLQVPANLATANNNLSILYFATKEYDKAFEYNDKAIDIATKSQDLTRLRVYKFQRIQFMLALSQFDEVDELLPDIAPEAEKFDNPYRRVAAFSTIGNAYGKIASNQMQGEDRIEYLKLALDYYFKGTAEAEILKEENNIASLKLNIGDTYLFLNDETKGFGYLNEAISIAKRLNNYRRLRSAFTVFERHFQRTKQFEKAYYYLDSVKQINDSIFSIEKSNSIRELREKYETEKKENENLQLTAENERQKLKNERQKFLNNIYLLFGASTLLFLVFVSILLMKNLKKKRLLENSKRELEQLNHNLKISKEETEKALEFKSLFLANMSHEIRTPLNIIIGFNTILGKNITDPKLKKYVKSIETGSYNLLRFLTDVLDMSKIEAGKVVLNQEIINLRLMIFDLKELFNLKAEEKGLQLHVDIENNVPQGILFDEIRLRQILVNLLGNAIKFTDQGFVGIKVSSPGVNKYQNELATKTTIQISVTDSGIGIDAGDQSQIFESFKQVNLKERKDIGGTGLGLAISKRLTELLGGTITVESKKGKGSTFTVTFKNVTVAFFSEEAGMQKTLPEKNTELYFEESTLLIADDEEMNRSLITVCFENTKVKVLEASNGREAMEIAKSKQPNVILMDLKMPFVDGIESGRLIKNDETTSKIPVIAFSASNIYHNLNEEDSRLFSGLISKPLVVDELLETVAGFLPHKIIQQPKTDFTPDKAFQFSFRNDLTNINDEIINILQSNFFVRWKSIHDANSMKKIIEFASDLKKFSISNKLSGLESYTQSIIDAANGFDVEDVKKLLRQFPDILHLLKI